MTVAPKVSKVSARQLAADKANLIKARAVARTKPRTARQKAVSRLNLVKARAAQKSRRKGKTPVRPKTAQSPVDIRPDAGSIDTEGGTLHDRPVCAATALAESLWQQAGIAIPDTELIDLMNKSGRVTIGDLIEQAAAEGFCGARLLSFQRADPGLILPGLVYGVRLRAGYHAVCTVPGGMRSWGLTLPYAGTPEEAWITEWEDPDGREAGPGPVPVLR